MGSCCSWDRSCFFPQPRSQPQHGRRSAEQLRDHQNCTTLLSSAAEGKESSYNFQCFCTHCYPPLHLRSIAPSKPMARSSHCVCPQRFLHPTPQHVKSNHLKHQLKGGFPHFQSSLQHFCTSAGPECALGTLACISCSHSANSPDAEIANPNNPKFPKPSLVSQPEASPRRALLARKC